MQLLAPLEIESVTCIQIMNKAFCFSLCANARRNLCSPQAIGKQNRLGSLAFVRQPV